MKLIPNDGNFAPPTAVPVPRSGLPTAAHFGALA